MSDNTNHNDPAHDGFLARVSRRRLIVSSGASLAAAGIASISAPAVHGQEATPVGQAMPMATPMAGDSLVQTSMLPERPAAFFTIQEAQLVDALVSRIMPGSADDPGAHEAGVVFYIDNVLAGPNLGYDYMTYKQGPFLVTTEDQATVEQASATDLYRAVFVSQEQAPRYGYQSVLTPQEMYRRGLEFVDAYAQNQFQDSFAALSSEQQDSVLGDMASGNATGFAGPSATAFFTRLRNDTIEGMFCDPMYGGNRDMVGWRLIGYPGAQRNYTPDNLTDPNFSRPPQSLAEMMASEGH